MFSSHCSGTGRLVPKSVWTFGCLFFLQKSDTPTTPPLTRRGGHFLRHKGSSENATKTESGRARFGRPTCIIEGLGYLKSFERVLFLFPLAWLEKVSEDRRACLVCLFSLFPGCALVLALPGFRLLFLFLFLVRYFSVRREVFPYLSLLFVFGCCFQH